MTKSTEIEKQSVLAGGFEVVPAQNGGWVIHTQFTQAAIPIVKGAFTNSDDLIKFISEDLQIGKRKSR